ncbi:hypothetical protein [Arthrobacter sp. P2b]|uniref:hypothetical protein n=1 Tax=Arthrobacter sp. P2b TaxID=1938741 RepID=UPI0009C925C7|nr:hypothetical protein [Arthrobacter sp. P2b]SLJ96131.1 hypothetical protein SAMN06272721_1028 [Arthrobacter sp. P2b]
MFSEDACKRGDGAVAGRWWTGAIAWVLLVFASMVLISIGLARTMYFVWAPELAMLERARVGGLFIDAGCLLSLAAAVVVFPLVLAGVAEVISARGRRQRG